jgi:hypothetical protein
MACKVGLILHDPVQIAQNPLVKFHLLTNIARGHFVFLVRLPQIEEA